MTTPTKMSLPKRLLTIDETTEVLGCSMKTLRRRIAEGAIAVIRDGRLIRIHPDDLRALHPAAAARVTDLTTVWLCKSM